MSPADEAGIVMLRKSGVGSPEVARRFGVSRREVDRVMRRHERKDGKACRGQRGWR